MAKEDRACEGVRTDAIASMIKRLSLSLVLTRWAVATPVSISSLLQTRQCPRIRILQTAQADSGRSIRL